MRSSLIVARMNLRLLLALLSVGLLCSCGRQEKDAATLSGPPEKGAIYSLNDGEGGFRAGKVLAVDDDVVFVNLYSERWPTRPPLGAVQKVNTPAGLGFSMESFARMQPVRLQPGNVSAEELTVFEEWKQSNGAVF